MPIEKTEWSRGQIHVVPEVEILSILNKNPDKAFTQEEIARACEEERRQVYDKEKNLKEATHKFYTTDFSKELRHLREQGKIELITLPKERGRSDIRVWYYKLKK